MMNKNEKILTDYVIKNADCCPFEKHWENNLEKECVGLGENGCNECILRNIEKLITDI